MPKFFNFLLLSTVASLSLSACTVQKSSVVKLNTGGLPYDVDLTPHDKTDN